MADSSISSAPSSSSSNSTIVRHTRISRTRDKSSNEILNGKYVLTHKSLGSGSYSTVELAHTVSSPPLSVAIKKVSKARLHKIKEYGQGPLGRPKVTTALDKIYKEILIHEKLHHANIVSIHEIFDDPNEDTLLIVIDYCEGGAMMEFDDGERKYKVNGGVYVNADLMNTHKGYGEKFCRHMFAQLIDAVEYLHGQRVVHRDIKPDNLLVDVAEAKGSEGAPSDSEGCRRFHLKLCDFSVSREFSAGESGMVMDTQGTYHFYSPEMCVGEEYSAYKADMYMMGQTLYCWATTRVPFWSEGGNPQELFDMIAEQPVKWPDSHGFTAEFVDFVNSIMCKDPSKRPGFQEMRAHPWMKKV